MPTKPKKRASKTPAKKKPSRKAGSAGCNLPDVCTYLGGLYNWYNNTFLPDYQLLRVAMCNVEKQAFAGAGNPAKRYPPCGPGPGGDPIVLPGPPHWP